MNPFEDPEIFALKQLWNDTRAVTRTKVKLELAAQGLCRSRTGCHLHDVGIKEHKAARAVADRLWKAYRKGERHPTLLADKGLHITLDSMTCGLGDMERLKVLNEIQMVEKALGCVPVMHMAESIRGLSDLSIAKIAAEVGDMSVYEKGVAGIWKRAGLAVIDGERQRKKKEKELALRHGYSPTRRSTFYVIGETMFKTQGKGDEAGPYRQVYDARRAATADRGWTKMHAMNDALRYMTKRLVKDMWREWRRVKGLSTPTDEEWAAMRIAA